MAEVLSSRFEGLGTRLEREARLSGAVALARLSVVHLDFSKRAISSYSDPAGILGFSVQPTLQELLSRVPTPELKRLRRLFGFSMKSRKDGEAEFRYNAGDGTDRWLSVRFSAAKGLSFASTSTLAVLQDVTISKTKELALQKGEMIKNAILETAVDAMVTIDAAGRVVGWNQAAEMLFGYARDFAIGQDLVELVYPSAEVERRRHGLRQVLSGLLPGAGRQINVEMVRSDGSTVKCEMAIRPIEVEGRRHFTAFVHDISDRAEPTINPDHKFSDGMLRAMADLCPGPVWVAYADGYVTYVNEHWRDFTGMSLEDALPVGWLECFHPDDVASFLMAWSECVRNGTAVAMDVRMLRHDGQYRWCEIKVQPQFDKSGNLVAWLGSGSDVTIRRDLEEVLREQRDRLWNMSADLIGVYRSDGTMIAFNPAWTSLLGIPEEEMKESRFVSWLQLEGVKRPSVSSPSIRMGEGAFLFDAKVSARDGSVKLVSWTVVPHQGLYYAVGRDLTAEREASDALRQTEEALRQSQKLEAIGQLTGGIAHDLNNTLQGVVGGLSLVSKRVDIEGDEKARKALDMASRSAKKASGFIDRLLLFARRKRLEVGATDVGSLVTSLEDLVVATVGKRVDVVFDVAPDLPHAVSDVDQLESAVINLVINARDAMPAGGDLRVTVSHDSQARPSPELPIGDWVKICVTDTGTGMRPEEAANAFDPFFTTKPIGQGTGLGLSMVYGFTKQVGGHADIETVLGRGTSVTMWFPIPLTVESVGVQMDRPAGITKPTTLLVEPDQAVSMEITRVLENVGCKVTIASTAEEALPVLQSGVAIDLLFTADALPGMNGRQLAEIARQWRPTLSVVFATGYTNSPIMSGQLPWGMATTSKPVTADGVSEALSAINRPEPT